MTHGIASSSHIVLDRDVFAQNVSFIRNVLQPDVKLSAVIKGNAYGHGIQTFVPMAEQEGISHFSVYGIEEAMDFNEVASEDSQLMIMGYIAQVHLPWTIRQGYEFFIYDLYQLECAIEVAQETELPAKIHIEMETGMNRTGFSPNDFDRLCEMLHSNADFLELSGVATHFAGAESLANHARVSEQLTIFNDYLSRFDRSGIKFKSRHAACSAAALRYPESQFDMVRIGILLYGFWPNRETLVAFLSKKNEMIDPLTSVLSWKSQVMSIKHVNAGEYIGYGTSYLTNRPTVIAIVPVGYAYGYARSLSNQGRVLIHGKRVAVVGIVNMNMMAVDVTGLEDVKHGDEVVLIGFQGENRITVASFGELSSQLNYELLARLPHNIPRTILN